MQFKLLALISMVASVSAGLCPVINQVAPRIDQPAATTKYVCNDLKTNPKWHQAKIACFNLNVNTLVGSRNKGCEVYANCYGDREQPYPQVTKSTTESSDAKAIYCYGLADVQSLLGGNLKTGKTLSYEPVPAAPQPTL